MSYSGSIQDHNDRVAHSDNKTAAYGLLEKYLPLCGAVGGLAGGIVFMDAYALTGNGWYFLASIFSLFFAVSYYRWITSASIPRQERAIR